MNDLNEKTYDERPWGNYRVLHREDKMWVKRIEVKPNKRLSLQKHAYREERWVVTEGEGVVTRNEKSIQVHKGKSVEIACGDIHRIENTGNEALVFIEVALGEKLSEEDIIRIEDDFGRA
ncbi:phosphomannose isomerase type II C-terminal cupin domain [PVC group bacterium]|nr:phosphomannose isomerase type II C-terminal cupin domain [PVC group bacterium]